MMIPGGFGDRAGEHLRMARGKYSAWPHVILGFLMVALLIAVVVIVPVALVLEPPGRAPYFADRHERDRAGMLLVIAGVTLGFVLGSLVFRDRWRCVEAFASRYCSGITNFSLLYVPAIAAGYAFVRGARKVSGDERPDREAPLPVGERPAMDAPALIGLLADGIGRQKPQPGVLAVAIGVIVVALGLVVAGFIFWRVKPTLSAPATTTCPDNSSYCQLPLTPEVDGSLAAAGLSVRLEPGRVDVAPDKLHVTLAGTITHQEASELETLQLELRLYDAAGSALTPVPIKVRESFMPPLRSGDSAPWYERAPLTAMPRRAVLAMSGRYSVPAPPTPDAGSELTLELPASAPRHFKLSAVARSREARPLGLSTSGKMVAAIQNDGQGVVRELAVRLVPRGGVGRDLGPTHPVNVAYAHMPPMYPGERRVVALSYYVTGQVAEERLVVTELR